MKKFRIIVIIIISLLLISCNKNDLKYNCTLERWNQFEELLNQYNIEDSLKVEFDALVDSNYVDMTCIMIDDPLYFEIDINNSGRVTHQIIKCIDGKYFSFEVNDYHKTLKATQIDLDSYNSDESLSMYYEVIRSANESLELDYKKVELIELADCKFQMRCKFADIPGFTETIKEYEIEQYAPNFYETILTIIFTLDDDWLQMEMNTEINLKLVDRNYNFPISMKYKFYFNGVSERDTTEYIIEKPHRLKDIVEETPISHIPLDHKSYLYCYFDAGYYYLDVADDNSEIIRFNNNYTKIELYDEKYQRLDNKDFKDFPVSWTDTRRLIHVQKSGYYYVYLELEYSILRDTSADFYVLFDKINIEEEKEVKVLQSAKGELTWMFDYECFRYESADKDSLIKITNNLTTPLTVYAIYDLSYTKFKAGKVLEENDNFLTFNPREDEPFDLYIVPSHNPYTQQVDIFEYDFTVEIIQNKNGSDLNELSLITDDYQEEYLYGPGYERYVILDVKEAGIYVFYAKYNHESTASLHVRINNSNYSYSSYNFKPGKYVLKFAPEGNIYNGCIVQVKYVYRGDLG